MAVITALVVAMACLMGLAIVEDVSVLIRTLGLLGGLGYSLLVGLVGWLIGGYMKTHPLIPEPRGRTGLGTGWTRCWALQLLGLIAGKIVMQWPPTVFNAYHLTFSVAMVCVLIGDWKPPKSRRWARFTARVKDSFRFTRPAMGGA